MNRIRRNAVVPCSRETMFALVADVGSYPEFVPLCRQATARPVGAGEVEASMYMVRGPVRFWLRTRNHEEPPARIDMTLVEGPFGRLEGSWTFTEREDGRTEAVLELEFEIASRLVGRVAGVVLEEVAESMVHAFAHRAEQMTRTAPGSR